MSASEINQNWNLSRYIGQLLSPILISLINTHLILIPFWSFKLFAALTLNYNFFYLNFLSRLQKIKSQLERNWINSQVNDDITYAESTKCVYKYNYCINASLIVHFTFQRSTSPVCTHHEDELKFRNYGNWLATRHPSNFVLFNFESHSVDGFPTQLVSL